MNYDMAPLNLEWKQSQLAWVGFLLYVGYVLFYIFSFNYQATQGILCPIER
jgi:hypothetical protein